MNYKYLRILKNQLFNFSSLFLICLTTLVIWFAWLNIQVSRVTTFKDEISSQKIQEIKVRVIRRSLPGTNPTVFHLWHQGAIWRAEGLGNVQSGQNLIVLAQKEEFKIDNDRQEYQKSLGVVGQIKVRKIVAENQICDWLCLFISEIDQNRLKIASKYDRSICGFWKFIPDLILPNAACSEVPALSKGLVLGGTESFSKDIKDDFRQLGLTHLVAVSGFQVGLLLGFVEVLTSSAGIARKVRLIFSVIFLIIMIGLVGPQPPVLRSGISMILSLFILYFMGRKLGVIRALIYSALIMLFINPFYLLSASFQLSFVSSLGLAISMDIENLSQINWINTIQETFLGTVLSFLFTLPIIINLSGAISLFSIISNVVIVPFIPIITLFNLAGLIPVIGDILIVVPTVFQSLMLFFVADLGEVLVTFELTDFSFLEMVFYYLFLIMVIFCWKILFSTNQKSLSKLNFFSGADDRI